jgi:hypothetical protein
MATSGFRLGIYVCKDVEIIDFAAPRRARIVDAGCVITAGGISSGTELGFHLLRRAGYGEDL